MRPVQPVDLMDLMRCSVEIGADRLLVQAAGGNTSIKQDGVMWIKASGTQLAQALTKDIFVAVDLSAMANDLEHNPKLADEPQRYLFDAEDLKPSIETSLHAVFKSRVVLHAHCVNTIAFAVQSAAPELLRTRLADFNWAFVPYAKPGADLARSVAQALQSDTQIIVLGNHGVLVTGDTVAEAHALLIAVQTALNVDVPSNINADVEALRQLAGEAYIVLGAEDPVHQVAMSPERIKFAAGGSLYPDHVTFCGVAAHALSANENAGQLCIKLGYAPMLIIAPGFGVLVHRSAAAANLALARCLSDVLVRVPENAALSYLTDAQNHELIHWDAETYRQKLNA